MRLSAFVDWSRVIEPFALLTVFLKANLVFESQVIACRHVKDRTTDVCIALPEATYNTIDVIDLQKFIEVELSNVLKHGLIMNIPLEQLNLDSFRVIIVFVNLYKAACDLVSYRRYSDRQTAEAVFNLVKHVK